MAPCLGHCGVSSAVCPLWAWSHWLASSTCALTLAKSTPRKVTMHLMAVQGGFERDAHRCLWQGRRGSVWLRWCWLAGGSAWPLVAALQLLPWSAPWPASCNAAAMRCLHQLGRLREVLAVTVPLRHVLRGAVGLWLATLALPSASSSTSPLRTMATALSTLPLHSGRSGLGLLSDLGHSLTPCWRVVCSKSGALTSSQRELFYCYHCLPFPSQRVLYLAVGECEAPQRPLCFNMTLLCFALALAGLSPCRGISSCLLAPSPAFSLAQRHRHVVYKRYQKYLLMSIVDIKNIWIIATYFRYT